MRVPDKHQTGPVYTRLRLKAAARCTQPSHTYAPPRFSDRSQLSSLSTRFDSSSIKSPPNTNTLRRYLAETRGAPQCHPRPVWLPQLSEATQDDYSSHSLKSLNLFSSPGAARCLGLKRTPPRDSSPDLRRARGPAAQTGGPAPAACRGPKAAFARGAGMCRTRPGLGFLRPVLGTGSDRSGRSFLRTFASTATAPCNKRGTPKSVCLSVGPGLTPRATSGAVPRGSSSSRLLPLPGWWGRGCCAGVTWPQLGAERVQLPAPLPAGSVPMC